MAEERAHWPEPAPVAISMSTKEGTCYNGAHKWCAVFDGF